ncbi:hypothetical protein [Thalassotalea atypica]|uniref:hypothetical protein n=1 Tax=Thalassotalea atypica TaxID=2054316 RepID=UPI002573933F|nr:hypothetical protein [Thalassotalea atypica]
MTKTTQVSDEAVKKSPSHKTLLIYVLLSIFFLVFAALSFKFELFPYPIVCALIALAISIVLFGILDSTAKVTIEESKIGKSVSLGGSIAGYFVIYKLLVGAQEPVPEQVRAEEVAQVSQFDLQFKAPTFSDVDNIDSERLSYSQTEPSSSYSDHPIVPVNIIAKWRKYLIVERKFDNEGLFKGILKRVVLDEYMGSLADVPTYNICMSKKEDKTFNTINLLCEVGHCLPTDGSEDHVNSCNNASVINQTNDRFSLFSKAYASAKHDLGWIAPSLKTLKERHQTEKITYMSFKVKSDALNLPETVDSYTYQIKVNGVPLYINGWQQHERTFQFDNSQPFELEFGLQNLDFSGVHDGEEKISLDINFIDSKSKLVSRTDQIERMLVALRRVNTENVSSNSAIYEWSGTQHFGKSDGVEVFIWSTPDINEMSRRKRFFDEENISFEDYRVMAVARPPLGSNTDYGLVVGLQDQYGRVSFTFDEVKADELMTWLNIQILPRKKRVDGTDFYHSLIKEPYKYVIKGY